MGRFLYDGVSYKIVRWRSITDNKRNWGIGWYDKSNRNWNAENAYWRICRPKISKDWRRSWDNSWCE